MDREAVTRRRAEPPGQWPAGRAAFQFPGVSPHPWTTLRDQARPGPLAPLGGPGPLIGHDALLAVDARASPAGHAAS